MRHRAQAHFWWLQARHYMIATIIQPRLEFAHDTANYTSESFDAVEIGKLIEVDIHRSLCSNSHCLSVIK